MIRSILYKTARALSDLHAAERGRVPQRLVRKFVYRHAFKAAVKVCRILGV